MATWIKDLLANAIVGMAFKPQVVAATTTGTAVDCAEAPDMLAAIVVAGTLTDGGYTPKIMEADTSGGTYSQVTPLDGAFSEVTTANDEAVHARKFRRTKRFIRIDIDETTAGTTGGPFAGLVVAMKKAT